MATVKVLQVVGFKNSGKTTLVEHWVRLLGNQEQAVAVLKHHGHEKGLALPDETTDSMRFTKAGAISSLATDGAMLQMHYQKLKWEIEDLIDMAKQSEPDVLLIEGFKNATYPKVVIVRTMEDWDALQQLENIVCVIVHPNVQLENVRTISLNRRDLQDEWLFYWLGGESDEVI